MGWSGGVGGKVNEIENGEIRVGAFDAEGAMYLDIHMTDLAMSTTLLRRVRYFFWTSFLKKAKRGLFFLLRKEER